MKYGKTQEMLDSGLLLTFASTRPYDLWQEMLPTLSPDFKYHTWFSTKRVDKPGYFIITSKEL